MDDSPQGFVKVLEAFYRVREHKETPMQRHHVKGARPLPGASILCGVDADSTYRAIENAHAEIERLKFELSQAREVESLTEATSDFVRLML
jgi:hypothetical protein